MELKEKLSEQMTEGRFVQFYPDRGNSHIFQQWKVTLKNM